MKNTLSGVVLIGLCIGCASWQVSYQPTGRFDDIKEPTLTVSSPDDIRLYIGEIPEGFFYRDGVLYVDTSYGNRVLGPLIVEVKRPPIGFSMLHGLLTLGISLAFTSTPPNLDREKVVRMLQEKCHAIGGNTVINAVIPRPGFKGYGLFSGMAVIMKQAPGAIDTTIDKQIRPAI
ncbi:MAG: hypothetical protein JW915_10335 [Chitinispirillaceae bacterium]|nr:hypothetical protein [Chitinispirillaceae bacterium]